MKKRKPSEREVIEKAESLKRKISKLRLHFEMEKQNCSDPGLAKMYSSSAKTLQKMETRLSCMRVSEASAWQEHAYTFLV